jgi:hypothetical protein
MSRLLLYRFFLYGGSVDILGPDFVDLGGGDVVFVADYTVRGRFSFRL